MKFSRLFGKGANAEVNVLPKEQVELPVVEKEAAPQPLKVFVPVPEKEPVDKRSEPQYTEAPYGRKGLSERAERIYGGLVLLYKNTVKRCKDRTCAGEVYAEARDCILEASAELRNGNDELLVRAYTGDREDVSAGHALSVCLTVLRLGQGFGFKEENLLYAGCAALYHDIDNKCRTVELSEWYINATSKEGHFKELLEELKGLELPGVSPKDFPPDKFIKIIGLADMYDLITHSSGIRRTAHETIKILIENTKDPFENRVVKMMVEELSVFPLGSYVKLNNDEICRVVRVNRKFPTRPLVEVVLDKTGKPVNPARYVNLTESPLIQVKAAVDELKFNKS